MTLDKRDKAMAILYMVNFVGNSGYAISLPFFPPMAVDKGISESTVGYVYSLYPVGAFIVSACLGSNLTLANSKNVVLMGILLSTLGMLGMGLLKFVDDKTTFIVLACLTRTIQGVGGTCCFTPSYSMAASMFEDQLKKVMARMELVSGVALFAGPLIGSCFYLIGVHTIFGGYQLPFYILCLIYIFVFFAVIKWLDVQHHEQVVPLIHDMDEDQVSDLTNPIQPGENKTNSDALQKENKGSRKSLLSAVIAKLTYYHIFSIPILVVTQLAFTLIWIFAFAIRTYLAIYLEKDFGLTSSQSTMVFLTNTAAFALSAAIVGHVTHLNLKMILAVGMMIMSLSFIIIGPDSGFTMIPAQLWIVIVGNTTYGLAAGAICAMFISELVFIMRDRFKNNDQDINDLASALYTMGWFVGEFAGPLLGAWLVPWVGFARTGGILAILMLVTDAVYVVIAIYDASTRKQLR